MAGVIVGDHGVLAVDSANAKLDIDSVGRELVHSVSRVRWVLIAVASGAFGLSLIHI